jgi:hypothetical protein
MKEDLGMRALPEKEPSNGTITDDLARLMALRVRGAAGVASPVIDTGNDHRGGAAGDY